MSVVEAVGFAQVLESNVSRLETMQFGQCPHRIAPHLPSLFSTHALYGRILEESSIEEAHHIKGRANDAVIFAERVRLRYGDIGVLQGGNDFVFAIDAMCGLAQDGARGLLAKHISFAVGGGDEIGRVRLAKAELCEIR